MQQNVVLCSSRVVFGMALAPVITSSICIDGAFFVVSGARDGQTPFGHGLQSLLAVFVPEVVLAIGASSDKGSVHWMKLDGVDSPNAVPTGLVSVALEGEVLALKTVIDMVHSHPPLNGANQVASGVWKAGYASGLELEGRLQLLDNSTRVAEVEDLDAPVGQTHHKQWCAHIHPINSVWQGLR